MVQLVITIIALIRHQYRIVQTSLLGAVFSNTLLIVGIGFFLGGMNRDEQHFNPMATGSSFNELVLAVAALMIPTAISIFSTKHPSTINEVIVKVSRAESIPLFLSYICYVYYCYQSPQSKDIRAPHQRTAKRTRGLRVHTGDAEKGIVQAGAGTAAFAGDIIGGVVERDMLFRRVQRVHPPKMSLISIATTLVIDTVLLGFCTTFAVDSIDGLTQKTALTQSFTGLVLLPLLGCNLHAIKLATKDEMPQSFAISVGSSIQLLLGILPLAVIIAWIRQDSAMTLLFEGFQVISLAVSVLILKSITDVGKSNW